MPPRAVIPGLWLALTGAALPQSVTPATVLECNAPREAAVAAFATSFPIERTIDRSVAPDIDITHIYKLPDYTVFGQRLTILGASHTRSAGKESMIFMSITDTPYWDMRAAAMKAQGLVNCRAEVTGKCVVLRVESDGWERSGLVEERDGRAVFTCTYRRIAN